MGFSIFAALVKSKKQVRLGPPYPEKHKLTGQPGKNISVDNGSVAKACPSSFFTP